MKNKMLGFIVLTTMLISLANATTIFIAGASSAEKSAPRHYPQCSWVQALTNDFIKEGVKVDNMALGGRSTKSFIDEGHWGKLIKKVQPGDFVLIQFGHNDQKKHDKKRYASVDKVYPENLNRFISEIKAKKANAIIVSSITRRLFIKGKKTLKYSLGKYPKAAIEVAKKNNVPYIDLNTSTRACVEKLGPIDSIKLYNHLPEGNYNYKKGHADNTHTNIYGAKVFAQLFVDEVKAKNLELAKYLK